MPYDPKKILVLVDSIDVRDSSGSKANVAMIKNLVSAGFDTTVLHYTRLDIEIEGATTLSIAEVKNSPYYFFSRGQRLFQRYFKKNLAPFFEGRLGFSFTFFNDSKSMAMALGQMRSSGYELLITLSKGESFRPHHAVLKCPLWHDKWLAYVHDPYPFQNYPTPYRFVPHGASQQQAFFTAVSQKCEWAAFPSLLLAGWMRGSFPAFAKKTMVIPHQYAPKGMVEQKPDFFDPATFSLVHAGNLLGGRSPEGLIKGFELFLKQNPEAGGKAILYLVGAHSNYVEMLENANIPSKNLIVDLGVIYEQAFYLQNHASVNVILEHDGDISPFLPGKFPNCVMANRPILALSPKNSEINRLLGISYRFSCTPMDVERIADLIGKLHTSWQDNDTIHLDRPDLDEYVSYDYLKAQIDSLSGL